MSKCKEIVIELGLDPTLEKQGVARTTFEKGSHLFHFPSSHFYM
jgi:hypothetical protein